MDKTIMQMAFEEAIILQTRCKIEFGARVKISYASRWKRRTNISLCAKATPWQTSHTPSHLNMRIKIELKQIDGFGASREVVCEPRGGRSGKKRPCVQEIVSADGEKKRSSSCACGKLEIIVARGSSAIMQMQGVVSFRSQRTLFLCKSARPTYSICRIYVQSSAHPKLPPRHFNYARESEIQLTAFIAISDWR